MLPNRPRALGDFGGDYIRVGKVFEIFQAIVIESEDV